jgi:5-carboxymethyl-2-hydroxymuconate isomerase
MPHVTIEYSRNLEDAVDMAALCEALREKAASIDAFPMPGIRVRAIAADHYAIADGNPQHGFVDISVRLRVGRSLDVRKDATAQLFETAKAVLAPVMKKRSVALSFEMRDIDGDLSPKTGTIRDYLETKT